MGTGLISWEAALEVTAWAKVVLGLRIGIGLGAVVVDARAVGAAVVAVDSDDGRLGELVGPGYTVGRWGLSIGLALGLGELGVLSVGLVDVAADFQVELRLWRGCSARLDFCVLVRPPLNGGRVCGGLPWLKAARSIANDLEVASERWSNVRWALFCVDLWLKSVLFCFFSLFL